MTAALGRPFSADETTDVGADYHSNVTPDYPQHGNEFNARIERVTIELD